MGEFLKKVGAQISEFLGSLSAGKRIALGLVGVVIVGGLLMIFKWAGQTTFKPLMTNLSSEDSANIIRILREKRIPFQVDPTGKNIEIPPEFVYDLRLELSTMGLPQSGVVGYELFDKQSLGTTSFVQKVNQKRALEGELIRTINTMRGVKRSRVHLVIPQKSTFVEDQKKPTASVVLDLDTGVKLNEKQIFGIQNLLSRAVEGLDTADVSIVDSEGKMLSKSTRDPLVQRTATQLDFQRRMEEELEKRVEAMLAPIVGEGHVVARVNAELDFSQVNETQTLYDGDGSAVRSVVKDLNSAEGTRPGPYGASGAASNQPGQTPAANSVIRTDTKKNKEITNFEIPQTVRQTQKPTGEIKRLSVAVVVDKRTVQSTGADGKVESKVEAWPAERIKEFEAIVASAVGFRDKRGDTIEIKNIEFNKQDFVEAERLLNENERKSYIQNIVVYSIVGLVIALFFLFVVRPFIKWVTENTIDSVDTFLPQTIEELERLQKSQKIMAMDEAIPVIPDKIDPIKVEGEMIKEKVLTLVDSNPHKAALVLKDWVKDAGKKAADKGDAGKSKTA